MMIFQHFRIYCVSFNLVSLAPVRIFVSYTILVFETSWIDCNSFLSWIKEIMQKNGRHFNEEKKESEKENITVDVIT